MSVLDDARDLSAEEKSERLRAHRLEAMAMVLRRWAVEPSREMLDELLAAADTGI